LIRGMAFGGRGFIKEELLYSDSLSWEFIYLYLLTFLQFTRIHDKVWLFQCRH
jgi:hypothetical protein